MEWLSWSNFEYLVSIMIGGGLTFAASKYRKVLKEIQEAYLKSIENTLDK